MDNREKANIYKRGNLTKTGRKYKLSIIKMKCKMYNKRK